MRPGIALQLHREAAAPAALARDPGADEGGIRDAPGTDAFGDFGHFLPLCEAAFGVLVTPAGHARRSRAAPASLAAKIEPRARQRDEALFEKRNRTAPDAAPRGARTMARIAKSPESR